MNPKTSIKTGLRDTITGFLRARPDIYIMVGVAVGFALLAIAFTAHEAGTMTDAEVQQVAQVIEWTVPGILAIPLALGVGYAGLRALARRTSLLSRFNREYVTREEHQAALERVRREVREELAENTSEDPDDPDTGFEFGEVEA